MKMKSVFVAAAIFAGTCGGALADVVTNGTFENSSGWTYKNGVGAENSFNKNFTDSYGAGVVAHSSSGNLGTLQQVLNLVAGDYVLNFSTFFGGAQPSSLSVRISSVLGNIPVLQEVFSASTGTRTFSFKVATAGAYNLIFGSAMAEAAPGTANLMAVDNVSVGVVPVPGPEAGAGLAGLTLFGMMAWMSKRRQRKLAA